MKQIKVSEATPIQLDWLVAKCNGTIAMRCGAGPSAYLAYIPKRSTYKRWEPTRNWKQGGPLIEREKISLEFMDNFETWSASIVREDGQDRESYSDDQDRESYTVEQESFVGYGPTPLIAAMRCYCCAKLGDEIEIPQELQPCQQPKT